MKFTINKKDIEYQEFNKKYPSQPAILSVTFKSNNYKWNKNHKLVFILEEWFYDVDGNEDKTSSISLSKSIPNSSILENLFNKEFSYQIDIHSNEAIGIMKTLLSRYFEKHKHSIEFIGF